MSEATYDTLESDTYDSAESPYESETTYESDSDSASDYAEDARRRNRQRRIVDARRSRGQMRAPQPPPQPRPVTVPGRAVRTVRAEVRPLDLDTRAMINSLHRRLDAASRAAARNAWASEASVAASQILDSFDTGLGEHDWARAVIRGAPTLLLAPGERRRPGLEGVLLDPRVAGGALLAAIWAVGRFTNVSKGVDSVSVSVQSVGPLSLAADGNTTAQVTAIALDRAGNQVTNATFGYETGDNTTIKVEPNGPVFTITAQTGGQTYLKITSDGKSAVIPINVASA
jgi:hypothetical protein